MLVKDQLMMHVQKAHVDVMEELKKDSPDIDQVRIHTALVAMGLAAIAAEYLQKVDAASSLEHPVVDIEWDVIGECDEDKDFCAAVALRRQSDELLAKLGRDVNDLEFQHQVNGCVVKPE